MLGRLSQEVSTIVRYLAFFPLLQKTFTTCWEALWPMSYHDHPYIFMQRCLTFEDVPWSFLRVPQNLFRHPFTILIITFSADLILIGNHLHWKDHFLGIKIHILHDRFWINWLGLMSFAKQTNSFIVSGRHMPWDSWPPSNILKPSLAEKLPLLIFYEFYHVFILYVPIVILWDYGSRFGDDVSVCFISKRPWMLWDKRQFNPC